MAQRWKRMAWWQRVYVVLEIPVFVLLVASFFFDYDFKLIFVAQILLLAFFVVMTLRTNSRKRRDGSYWGPRD